MAGSYPQPLHIVFLYKTADNSRHEKKRLSVPVDERFHAALKIVAAHEKTTIASYVQTAVACAVASSLNSLPTEKERREKVHDA